MAELKNLLITVLENYKDEVKLHFPGKGEMKQVIKLDIPQKLKSILTDNKNELKFEGSIGGGEWATIPWVAIMDSKITNKVSEGIYIVYLFCADGSGVFLTLNQGTGGISKARVGPEQMENRKTYLSMIGETDFFTKGMLNSNSLKAGKNPRAKAYEKACILWKYYSLTDLKNIINESELLKDLENLLNIYLNKNIKEKKLNYWIFQANPEKRYNVLAALKDGVLKRWLVNSHKGEINKGDKIILWVTGKYAGVYALATVDSAVASMPADEEEKKYFLDMDDFDNRDRVIIRPDIILDKPITKSEIDANVKLQGLNVSLQGTNFSATKEQYDTILSLIREQENKETSTMKNLDFIWNNFYDKLISCGYIFDKYFVLRFISTLCTKPFQILTGLSGSGKTKLAQAFTYWITENENQYCIIPVGADWTNREPLLGFPNSLEQGKYLKPENRVIDLIIEANKEENSHKPYFLILDEMNLSHVERYFADFLSVMESDEKIALHSGADNWDDVPSKLSLPPNLFIIGTVNVDETTYMFSPKVLDRAHVLEFRVNEEEMQEFLNAPVKPDLESIKGLGKNMASDFILKAQTEISEFEDLTEVQTTLIQFFKELKKIGAEFGYRTASEIYRFTGILKMLTKENGNEWTVNDIVDAAVIQKLLPKIHGSRSKLEPVLKTLAELCLINKDDLSEILKLTEVNYKDKERIKYPLSLEKILRMRTSVIQDGFTSFTEA